MKPALHLRTQLPTLFNGGIEISVILMPGLHIILKIMNGIVLVGNVLPKERMSIFHRCISPDRRFMRSDLKRLFKPQLMSKQLDFDER